MEASTATQTRTKKQIEDTGPKSPEELIAIGGVDDVPTDREASVELDSCIATASEAIEDKAKVLSRIQSARELSTLLLANGSGSREQAAWVRFYLPRKSRKKGEVADEDEE